MAFRANPTNIEQDELERAEFDNGIPIRVDDTLATAATGTVTLTGGIAGSVDGITVDGVEIMSGVEAFDTNLDTTATNVAANITAFTSSPNYTAVAVTDVITITSVTLGTTVNEFFVISSTTTITSTDVNMSGGLASIQVISGGLNGAAERLIGGVVFPPSENIGIFASDSIGRP